MAKKRKKGGKKRFSQNPVKQPQNTTPVLENEVSVTDEETALNENRVIKKDLLRALIVNVVFILLLVALYYWNLDGRPLDRLIGDFISL